MGEHPQATEGCCALGIDAAWTVHQPSGIALVQNTATGWSCLGVAPSYEAFITQASGQAWDPENACGMKKYAAIWRSVYAMASHRPPEYS